MINTISSFFAQVRETWFRRRLEWEIYHRIFPHLEGDANHGYPFFSDEEMDSQTESQNPATMLKATESHISRMPKAYSKAFRHIMYRDLQKRLRMYENLARRRVHPTTCDPRFIARRA